nr:outer membrane protein porin [Tanacetum cinerariifolium]
MNSKMNSTTSYENNLRGYQFIARLSIPPPAEYRQVQAEYHLTPAEYRFIRLRVIPRFTISDCPRNTASRKETTDDSVTSSEQLDESSSSGNDADADIGPLYDCDTVSEACHDMFENVFAHGIQNHEQPESIPDTYVVNKNNSNIIFDILNMDPNRGQEEHDDVDNEQQRALFASLINNLKCDVEKCNKTDQTLQMLLLKEDNVNTGKQGLGFKNKNEFENPSLLSKAKELAPWLYNIDELGKDSLSNQKIISEEELKCKAEKRLKVKQRKSPLSYHGFVYGETQFEEPPKFLLKRRNVNLKKHLEQTKKTLGTSSTKNETLSFETKIKELEMTLAQQTKEFEDAKVDFSKKIDKFETSFEKLENTEVVLERQLDRKIQDSKAEKEQVLKQIASLESKLASQDLISNQKEYSELRISYNALKAKFDVLNREKEKSPMSNFPTPKVSVSPKIYTGESSKSFLKRVSQFTTYSLQKDRKFSKKPQAFETSSPQTVFNSSDSSKKKNSKLLFYVDKASLETKVKLFKTIQILKIKNAFTSKQE